MTNQYSYADSFSRNKVEAPKKKIAESNISSAAKVYMLSRTAEDGSVKCYRNGSYNGQSYMTGEDFVTYFRSRGTVKADPSNVAKSTVSGAEVHRSRSPEKKIEGNTAGYRKVSPKAAYGGPNVSGTVKIYKPSAKTAPPKATMEDDDVKIYVPGAKASVDFVHSSAKTVEFKPKKKKKSDTAVFDKVANDRPSKLKKAADEWLPEDKIVNVKKDKKKKNSRPFSRLVLAVAGTAVSLMLIVSGSVLLSGADSSVKDLQRELRELEEQENRLSMELEMKNDVNLIRDKATEELGMIRKEYVEANYLDMSGEDGIELHEQEEKKNVGIAAILSAFGLTD